MGKEITVTNRDGRTFRVIVVQKGDKYGRNNCLVHDKEDALVEFWDMSNTDLHGEDGQFVQRYYLSTLKEGDQSGGLCLNGGVSYWHVTAQNVQDAIAHARGLVNGSVTSTLLRELEHNVLLKLRILHERQGWGGGIANALEDWLERRAPLLPGYEADWLPEHRDSPGVPTVPLTPGSHLKCRVCGIGFTTPLHSQTWHAHDIKCSGCDTYAGRWGWIITEPTPGAIGNKGEVSA